MKILIEGGPSPKSLHRLEDWLRCPRWYYFRHVVKRALPPAPPQVRGTLVHAGLAQAGARRIAQQQGQDPNAYYTPSEAIDLTAERERPKWGSYSDSERATAHAAVAAMVAKIEETPSSIRVLAAEQIWEIDVVGPRTGRVFQYTQRLDWVEADASGRVWVDDWKTMSGFWKDDTLKGYSASLQTLAFRWNGPRVWPERFGGTRIGFVGTTDDGSHPRILHRVSVDPAPALVQAFPWTIEQCELEIEWAAVEGERLRAAGHDPILAYRAASNELVCVHRYGRCGAWDICLWGEDRPQVHPGLVQLKWGK